jgi:hypothetical protein
MRRFVTGVLLAVLLAACGQAQYATEPAGEAAMAPAPPPMADMASDGRSYGGVEMAREEAAPTDSASAAAPEGPPSQPSGPNPILYLAYTYSVGLELPGARLATVMDAHVQACEAAGPRVCQLIGSNRIGDPESHLEGYVSLRAEPTWLANFMGSLSTQADEAGGRIESQSRTSEDLTRQIVDTEARLDALITLRGRLQQLLRSRPGRLADLLEVERELARVQSEIDSIQSTLAVMRTRVAMSELTLSYRSAPRPVGSDTFEPLRLAFAGFLGVVVSGFAVILYIIAGLIPLLAVAVPIAWAIMAWLRRRRAREAAAAAAAEGAAKET